MLPFRAPLQFCVASCRMVLSCRLDHDLFLSLVELLVALSGAGAADDFVWQKVACILIQITRTVLALFSYLETFTN